MIKSPPYHQSGQSGQNRRLRRRLARARLANQRGFTLVELVVATMAGLLVSAAAFLLARNSSSFFQSEAGITTAQFSNMLGFSRLQEDIRRASMMSSPNVIADPLRCGATAGWPAGMIELAGIRVEQGGSVLRHSADHVLSGTNGLNPDALIIGGLFDTTEQFAVQTLIDGGGGSYTIMLQNDGAMVRTRLAATSGSSALTQIFRTGRILRLVDNEGRAAYGVISGLNTTGTNVTITLANAPALPVRDTETTCGCAPPCRGSLVNPIARVLYDLRSVDEATYPQYAGLYINAAHGVGAAHQGIIPATRTELVRVELDAQGDEIPATLEILSEYAVDLKFGILTATPGTSPTFTPTLTDYDLDDANIPTFAGTLASGATPQRIRTLRVRMGVRASRRDRDVAIPAPPDGGLFRFNLGTDPSGNVRGFTRVRTLVSDVSLHNQFGVSW